MMMMMMMMIEKFCVCMLLDAITIKTR